jgi:DNA-directed RNA polymerase specialized sigma24 family protein
MHEPTPRSAFRPLASNVPAAHPRDLLDPLVRRAADGDPSAIGALARSFRPQLLAAAREHLPLADAEDLVQDVFVLLLEGDFPQPATGEHAAEWLLRTVETMAEELARDGA